MKTLKQHLILDCPTCYKKHIDAIMEILEPGKECEGVVCADIISFEQILHTLLYYYKHSELVVYIKKGREDLFEMLDGLSRIKCFYQSGGAVIKGKLVSGYQVNHIDEGEERVILNKCPHPTIASDTVLVFEGLPEGFCTPSSTMWKFSMSVQSALHNSGF